MNQMKVTSPELICQHNQDSKKNKKITTSEKYTSLNLACNLCIFFYKYVSLTKTICALVLQRTPQTKPYWEMYRQRPWGSPHLTHDLVVCFLKIKFIEGSSVSQIWLTENRLNAGTWKHIYCNMQKVLPCDYVTPYLQFCSKSTLAFRIIEDGLAKGRD